MTEYIYIIHPLRHDVFSTPTPDEKVVLEEHLQYLEKALADGILIMNGTCLDGTFESIIFRASNDEAARAFMFNDPSIESNLMVAELHPMRILLKENK